MLIPLLRKYLRALPRAADRRGHLPTDRHHRLAVPAGAERRDHRRRGRQGRHRLHPVHRHGHARRSPCCRSSARSSPSTSAPAPRWASAVTSAAALFHQVGTFSDREMAKFGAPTLITRNTNDVQQVQMLVLMTCTLLVAAPIMCIGGIFMALKTDLGLAWLLLVSVPVLVIAISLIVVRMIPQFRQMQARIDVVNRVLREQISGVRVVRAFVREPLETRRFADANAAADRHRDPGRPADGADVPHRHAGAERLQRRRALVRRAPGERRGHRDRRADRVSQLPDADPVLGDDGDLHGRDGAARRGQCRPDQRGAGHRLLGGAAGQADHSRRPTPARSAWTGWSSATRAPASRCCGTSRCRARPGTTTAIIGSTGAGKTTLLSLIPRLFDATGGAVSVDDVDVRDFDPARPCGTGSAWCRRSRSCSPGRSPPTCVTATPTPPTRTSGRP